MEYILSNASLFMDGALKKADIRLKDGQIAEIASHIPNMGEAIVFSLDGCVIFPGFTDVHVHLREPGFSYKETIATGTRAAAKGGYTSICAMPNLQPVPDCTENLAVALACIKKSAVIRVYPYAAITLGQNGQTLCDFSALSRQAIAFSDDGRGVQDEALMRIAMQKVHALGKMIVAHCEDDSFLDGLCLHDGAFTASLGLKGIAAKSEWGQLARDIRLLRQTHCAYHACHISTKESVSLIRRAKREGLDITCETAPHYLLLDDSQLLDDGRFKMNPPIRAKEDREALIEGILDGTIDMIATDHAPHAPEEKSRGIAHSLNGVVGIETAFSVLYTELVKTGILSLSQLITLMHTAPQKRFQIETPLRIHAPANLTVFDLRKKERIDPQSFLSMGKSCPFSGRKVFGKCMLTICNGAIAWKSPDLITSEDNR